jgi:hypothetical protein
MQTRPSPKEREPMAERVISKIVDWVEAFVDGIGCVCHQRVWNI